ncbi:hypothetical protein Tsubulata_006863, partial [Turnera subulata]
FLSSLSTSLLIPLSNQIESRTVNVIRKNPNLKFLNHILGHKFCMQVKNSDKNTAKASVLVCHLLLCIDEETLEDTLQETIRELGVNR